MGVFKHCDGKSFNRSSQKLYKLLQSELTMGTAGIKIKIMPVSPETDLEKIKKEAKEIIEEKGGKNREYAEEPIAFGLKAVIAFFEWPEEKELEEVENSLKNIENVNSVQIVDMRRLF